MAPPRIAEGTAADRIISITDAEMRHGRKSKSRRFDGFKTIVATDQRSELLVDIADVPATGSDGQYLLPTLQRIQTETGLEVERAIADGAFGTGENRAACADELEPPVELVSPLARPRAPDVDKSAFAIDLEAKTATCPQGQTVAGRPSKDKQGRAILTFTFARTTCEACPLFARCVRSQSKGRTVTTHAQERHLQAARAFQQTEAFHALYPTRSAVERKIAEAVAHGLRRTRYVGDAKRQLQRLWLGAAINLKRLFKFAQTQSQDLRALLAQMQAERPEIQPT